MKTYEIYLSIDPISDADYPEKYWFDGEKINKLRAKSFESQTEALAEAQRQVQIYRMAIDFNVWFFLDHYIAVVEIDEDDNETIIEKTYLNPNNEAL